jgi:type II secretory pathway component PulF
MEQFPRVFTPFHLGMMKTAERSGTLPEVLKYLAEFEEKEMRLHHKIQAALAYPMFVTITAIIVVILLTRYLCPLLNSITAILGEDKIPLITRGLIFVGRCTTDIRYIAAIIAVVIAVLLVTRALLRSRKVLYVLGRIKLRLPSLGNVYKKVILVRVCRVMSTLLHAGVPSVLSIRILDEVAENVYFSEAIMKKIIWRVDEGKHFSEAFGESRFFPIVFINMLVVGEQTGKLPFIIGKLADLFDIDVTFFLDNITSILEPLLVLVMGCVTFLILLGAFLPMYAIMRGL